MKLNKFLAEKQSKFSGLTPDQRAELHRQISRNRSENEKWAIAVIKQHIMNGSSMLKDPVATGLVTMEHIIDAIKTKRCIGTPSQDIGHTYIKNAIGNIIRSEFPRRGEKFSMGINEVRRIFGLPEVSLSPKSSFK